MFSKNIAITDTTDGLPNPRRIWAVIAASLALIMSVLDANIVNVVLPTLSREFGTSPSTTIWVMNAYQLAITVSLLSFSSPGDIYGYHKVFLSGVAVFCVTSLICVLSTSFWMLTVARVLQGFGASAITSVNTAQLRTIYPRQYLGRGLGISAMVVAVSAVAGPSVASIILSLGSWQWLFAINIPLGLLALIMGLIYLPHREKKQNRKFDKTSALANALTFGLLIYSMEGFAHHENAYLLAAQIFLYRRLLLYPPSITSGLSVITGRFVENTYFFPIGMYIDLLVHSPDAGFGISPVLLTKYVRTHGGSYRFIADSLARSDFVHGSFGRVSGRTHTCRNFRKYRDADFCYRSFPADCIAGYSYRWGDHLAYDRLWDRFRTFSDSQ